MAINGFFAGGMAEGIAGAQKQALAERTQTEDSALRSRGLNIQEAALSDKQNQQMIARVDQQIADTMGAISETVKAAIAGGRDPAAIQKAVQPLVQSAQQLASRVGRDPNAIAAQANALLTTPSAVQTATTTGRAAGVGAVAKDVAYDTAINQPGVNLGERVPREKRAEVENKEYDNYRAHPVISEFAEVASAKTRMDALPPTESGDVALLFNYMRVTNPKLAAAYTQDAVANAANNGTLPKEFQSVWNVMHGKGSTPALAAKKRTELKGAADSAYEAQAQRYDEVRKTFQDSATRRGLNPKNVVGADLRVSKRDNFASRFGDIPPPPDGFVVSQ